MDARPRTHVVKSHRPPPAGLVFALAFGLLAVMTSALALLLRGQLHEAILAAEGEAMLALVNQARADPFHEGDPVSILLEASGRPGIVGAGLYAKGPHPLESLPVTLLLPPLAPADRAALEQRPFLVRFIRRADAADLFGFPLRIEAESHPFLPLVEITLPFTAGEGPGAIRFLSEGWSMRERLHRLDRSLVLLVGSLLLAAGLLLAGLLHWSYSRLRKSHGLLEQSSRELSEASRNAAIGSLTAHLLHGIKSPVHGLLASLENPAHDSTETRELLRLARQGAQRLEAMVNRTLGILQDVHHGLGFEWTAEDFGETLRRLPLPESGSLPLRIQISGTSTIDNLRANHALLILETLIENAREAAGPGTEIGLRINALAEHWHFTVRDHGPGIEPQVRERLFQPGHSTKPHGAGLGLSIARQLARQAGGDLRLINSGPAGTTFRLVLPAQPSPSNASA